MRRSASRTAGFTLIEILVVLTIIAAIIGIAVPIYTKVQDTKNVTLCKNNLKNLGGFLMSYRNRFKHYPRTGRSGVQFLLAPLKAKDITLQEDIIRGLYVCEGDDFAQEAVGGQVEEIYGEPDNLDPTMISYAGRNVKEYRLQRNHAETEVVACDAGGPDAQTGKLKMNHRNKINILYLDSRVSDIDIVELPNADPENFDVGPNSPLPLLQKLNKEQ